MQGMRKPFKLFLMRNAVPLVKVELAKGKGRTYLQELMTAVMDTVQRTLKLPNDDRNIRLIEHDSNFFAMKEPYETLVE